MTSDAQRADGTTADAIARECPAWTRSAATGHRWLFARVRSADGPPLMPAANHVDVYVRQPTDTTLGFRAEPNDPCAVGAYPEVAPKVVILAAAVGFSSRAAEVVPSACTDATPCTVTLPPALPAAYYIADASGSGAGSGSDDPKLPATVVHVATAKEVAQGERAAFAAALAEDALDRAKALKRPIAEELDKTATATRVPARELAIHYAEKKLQRRCNASCLRDTNLDPELRGYLKKLTPPGATHPFNARTPAEDWDR